MAFEKIEYISGDVLTADQMNKIQDAILTDEGNIEAHIGNKSNPHGVTASQVGAYTKTEVDTKISNIPVPDVSGQINSHNTNSNAHADIRSTITNHANNKSNPHGVTAAQVGITTMTVAQVRAICV